MIEAIETLHFFSRDISENNSDGSYALTALELYSDDKGRRVHLLTTGESGVLKIQRPVAHLQLTSPSGQRSKLSLKHALKTAFKQVCVSGFLENFMMVGHLVTNVERKKKSFWL